MVGLWWIVPPHPIFIAALQWSGQWFLWDVKVQGHWCWTLFEYFPLLELEIWSPQHLSESKHHHKCQRLWICMWPLWKRVWFYTFEVLCCSVVWATLRAVIVLFRLWVLRSARDQAVSACPWNAGRRKVCDVTFTCSFLWHLLFPFKGEIKLNSQFKCNVETCEIIFFECEVGRWISKASEVVLNAEKKLWVVLCLTTPWYLCKWPFELVGAWEF